MIVSSPTTFHPIDDIDAMDLTRHALVEASAGTGKTYTIENLVVRLLKEEPDLNLENILLVTFTEKATSELKLRIRQKIEQTLDGGQRLDNRPSGKSWPRPWTVLTMPPSIPSMGSAIRC